MSSPPASPDIHALWRNAQAVCFDIDSTVCLDEGIDVLAAHAGVGAQVAELTHAAMGGPSETKATAMTASPATVKSPASTDRAAR